MTINWTLTGFFDLAENALPVTSGSFTTATEQSTEVLYQLYKEDFNSGTAAGWNATVTPGAYTVENGEYSLYLQGCSIPSSSYLAVSDNWRGRDYIVELDFIRKEGVGISFSFGDIPIGFRTGWQWDQGHNYYFCEPVRAGSPAGEYTVPLNVWHRLRVEYIGNNVKIFIKQLSQASYTKLVDYTDTENKYSSGRIVSQGWSGGACIEHNHIDNIKVLFP